MVVQSNFEIDGFELTHSLSDPLDDKYTLFWPVYLQEKAFVIKNAIARIHGKPLYSNDPLDLHLENIWFEYDYANHGWRIESDCNYPEAVKTGTVLLRNHTIFSVDRKKMSELNGYISYTGPANFTVEECKFKAENSVDTNRSTLRLR